MRNNITTLGIALALLAVPMHAAHAAPRTVSVAVSDSHYLRLPGSISKVTNASSAVADVAAFPNNHVVITGKQPGTTTATVIASSGVHLIIVTVTFPTKTMREALRKAIPSAKKIDVRSVGSSVLVTGTVPSVEDIKRAEDVIGGIAQGATGGSDVKIINGLTVTASQQVQLEVSFAEVSRTSLREIGFNFWSRDVSASGNRGYAGGLTSPSSTLDTLSPQLGTTPDVGKLNHGDVGFDSGTGLPVTSAVPLVAAPVTGAFGFVFSSTLGGFPFSAALSLLASKGYSRTMAEPTIVAMSGKSASFLAGGEFPVPLPSSLGQTSVEYRKFGVQLDFTPTVLGKDIQLELAMTVSDIDLSLGIRLAGVSVPGLTERHSKTVIRLKDGQSFVIAGLLSDRVRSAVDSVPGLGSIPIIGMLFRSTSYRREESELLVVVTAHLVRPLNERPELPGETTKADPNDLELFFLGRGESKDHGEPRTRDSKRYQTNTHRGPVGAVGFIR